MIRRRALTGVIFKSKKKTAVLPIVAGWRSPEFVFLLSCRLSEFLMKKLIAFYKQYKQYILTDGLMYLIFLLALAIMFIFFR
jgi:hypothetical protein